jgi:magnesium chelatase family protein
MAEVRTRYTACLYGVSAHVVRVDVTPVEGPPKIEFEGDVPDAWARETRVRMMSALDIKRHKLPSRMRVSVSPYWRDGFPVVYDSSLDAAIFAALRDAPGIAHVGEVSLAGEIRPVRGVIARVRALHATVEISSDTDRAVLAALEPPVRWATDTPTLAEIYALVSEGRMAISRENLDRIVAAVRSRKTILLVGPLGAGKTMIARRLVSDMPIPLAHEQSEIAQIHDAAGLAPQVVRPFRAPHHTCSSAALFGSSSGQHVRPGEVSLAHGGILFLDEAIKFRSGLVADVLRTARRGASTVKQATMPAAALVVAAVNPCACGGGTLRLKCKCSEHTIARYGKRLDALRELFDVTIDMAEKETP